MLPNKSERRLSASRSRTEQDDARIVLRRVRADIGAALVHRQQHMTLCLDAREDDGVGGASQPFVGDRVRLMADGAQILRNLRGQIFVDFQFHGPAKGSRLSSRANSAA